MKPPKLDRTAAFVIFALGGAVALNLFGSGVEWERERAQKLEKATAAGLRAYPPTVPAGDGRCELTDDAGRRCRLSADHPEALGHTFETTRP